MGKDVRLMVASDQIGMVIVLLKMLGYAIITKL